MHMPPGIIRDSIVEFLSSLDRDASTKEIISAVSASIGADVAASSVRSYLNNNIYDLFERTDRGRFRIRDDSEAISISNSEPAFLHGRATLYHADCFEWLAARDENSIHAVITDPPYGLVEYSEREQAKLRNGKGGVWRVPPSFDGHKRSPLPRFTVLKKDDHQALHAFFRRLGASLARVCVPGANIVVASNPLLFHLVASAMCEAGLELRGTISRLVMTMRGGDRPKNAHEEFQDVSVMPRSMHEPWVVLRVPLEGRVQDNLRNWKTGGFRRPSSDRPFGDVIKSSPTPSREKKIAPHPSLKPQEFLRSIVRASLPLGEGTVFDPFAGSGSTLAAANSVGYKSVGTEMDIQYVELAKDALPRLTSLRVK